MTPYIKHQIKMAAISFTVSASVSLNLLVAGLWVHAQRSSAEQTASSSGQYVVSRAIKAESINDVGTPDLSGTEHGKALIEASRRACAAIMPPGEPICADLPVTVQELGGNIRGAVIVIDDKHNSISYARQMRLSPKIELGDRDPEHNDNALGLNYYVAHEWMHVRVLHAVRTPEGRAATNAAAAAAFSHATGAAIDADRGGEMLTDCATWDLLGRPRSFVPVYLNYEGASVEMICSNWRALLLG